MQLYALHYANIYVYIFLIVAVAANFSRISNEVLRTTRNISQLDEKPNNRKPIAYDDLVRQFLAGLKPELEPYARLQVRLEQIANEARLYFGSEEDNRNILQNLQNDPEVQNIIQECNKFHSQIKCHDFLYRKADGTCNNLIYPLWGSANIANDRFLPSVYYGISYFRKSVNGLNLPAPRDISLLLENGDVLSEKVSSYFYFFGQPVTHDVTLAPATSVNGLPVPCCPYQHGYENFTHVCENIYISKEDPFYKRYNFTCVPIVRTSPYPKCNFDKRTPMNKKTSFLDASHIYGNDDLEVHNLRTNDSSGRLRTQKSLNGDLLPRANDEKTLFCPINKTETCFLAGDERVNQHTMLMAFQTMLVRYHNIIADILHSLNVNWNADKIYQETRRIVEAVYQKMIYTEYLPWLVGPKNMKDYGLSVNNDEWTVYDEKVNPTILIEFSTASFRLHSMTPKEISKYHPQTRMEKSYSFVEPLHEGQLKSFISGSCEVPAHNFDRFIKQDVEGNLYRPPGADYGIDLPAINIQRGRDHGLPRYIDVAQKCSEYKIKIYDFSDLRHLMTQNNINLLKKIYFDVADIDLWIGMNFENAIEGAVTGPTAACISALQFQKLKFGDSFFFTHYNSRYPFTKEQLKFIHSYSVSRWICETTNNVEIRKYPMLLPNKKNPKILCHSFPEIDLTAWKEN